jgi:hypothetical protein
MNTVSLYSADGELVAEVEIPTEPVVQVVVFDKKTYEEGTNGQWHEVTSYVAEEVKTAKPVKAEKDEKAEPAKADKDDKEAVKPAKR